MYFRKILFFMSLTGYLVLQSCMMKPDEAIIITVRDKISPTGDEIWLSHEHLLVDFIGADSIDFNRWEKEEVIAIMKPYLEEIAAHNVKFFVDATPAYLGRDAEVLLELSRQTGIRIVTNTGLYGA